MRRVLCSILGSVMLLSGCGGGATRLEDLNTTTLTTPNGSKIVAETMIQELDTSRGMMFHDALAPGRGMISIYPREEKHPAFTYNVRVPLDRLGERRLGHVQPRRGPAEVQLLGDGDEVAQVTELGWQRLRGKR